MPRIEEDNAQDLPITTTPQLSPISDEPATPQPLKINTSNRIPLNTTKLDPPEKPELGVVESEPLSIADFKNNSEVQNRSYRAMNYLANSKYDDKVDAVDKFVDFARESDFNITTATLRYADLLRTQKRDDPETKQYLEDIGWLYNEFYGVREDGKYKYDPKGFSENIELAGDVLWGAVTDLTNWAAALAFPFTSGTSAPTRIVGGEAARQTLKQAIKNAAMKGYKAIPKVPIDPRNFKQVATLTGTEGFVFGSTDNYLRQKFFNQVGVEGYEEFSISEMLESGAYGAAIGGTIGTGINVGYKYFDARALKNKKQQESEEFRKVIMDEFDADQAPKEIIVPGAAEKVDDAKIVTLEEAASESRKLREDSANPEPTHVEKVLNTEATVFDTPNIKNAGKSTFDEEPEIIIVDEQPKNKYNPDQKIIVGGVISRKTYDEAVSTYLVFGKPTTYSNELAKIDPNFEKFLRLIRHDATESIFDNPLKVINDKLYENRSFMETTRAIAGPKVNKLITLKENLENSIFKYDRYKKNGNYKLQQGTTLNNDLYKFLNTGRFDADVPTEVVKAGYEIRKIFDLFEKEAVEAGFIFHSIDNFFPRYWKPGTLTNSRANKERLANQLMADEGMGQVDAFQAVDGLLNKIYDDLDPSIGSLGQRTYKKLNTIPIQDLLTDDVYAVTFMYANAMARKMARKKLFGFGDQEFNNKWLIPFFGGTLNRTTSQEGRDIIFERLLAKGFDESFLNQSVIKEYIRLNFLMRQIGKDLPDNIDDVLKLKSKDVESVIPNEKNNIQFRKDFKTLQSYIKELNNIGLTKNETELLKNDTIYKFIDDLIKERIEANEFILKSTKVDGTLSEKNVEYRNTLSWTPGSAAKEKVRVKKLHDYVVGIGGVPQNNLTQSVNAAANGILTAQALNKLGLATISSIPEFFIPFLKAHTKVAVKALLKTIGQETNRIYKNITGPQGRTLSRQELNEFNLVLKGSLAEAVQSSYSEGLGRMSAKTAYYFYRSILLDQYTKFMQIFAYNASKIMINDNLEALSKLSAQELASNSTKVNNLKLPLVQLGLNIDEGIKWFKGGQRTDDLFYENIKASGARFVDEVVMNPAKESAQKPLYMTHWAGRVVFQLYSYPVSFGNTVVRNAMRDLNLYKGHNAPRVAATLVTMLMAARLSRGLKTRGESLQEDYTLESLLKDLDTLGVGGPLSLLYGYDESKQYGRNTFRAIAETVGGPTFGAAIADFYTTKRIGTTLAKHMQPYRNVITKAYPEVQFEFDQLIKDIEDSFENKSQAEIQIRRMNDYMEFQKREAGITKKERELKEQKERIGKVTGGIVSGPEVPFTKEDPADRVDPFTGEPYQDQMSRLGFSHGGPHYNNMGNIESRFDYWAGMTGETYGKEGRFGVFDSPVSGMRAPLRDIKTKQNRYKDTENPLGHAIAEYLGGGREGTLEQKIQRATGQPNTPNYNPDVQGYINDVVFNYKKYGDEGIIDAIAMRESPSREAANYYINNKKAKQQAIELAKYSFPEGTTTEQMLEFLNSLN